MKIEAGKFYKTRTGKKVVVYSTTGRAMRHIRGCIIESGPNEDTMMSWYSGGVFFGDGAHAEYDLISEWVDKPVVDWSKLAAWHRWVARDEDGSWYVYAKRPELAVATWRGEYHEYQRIPENYSPTFSGDWKDSLVERPTE